ncbi:MAG: methylenetetrahydrofolate reductase [Elusimicrobiota bacterium]|jgi:5,10-methylenetetrahydrofolate reductase|nr:methylenetetrahydrofolate reductase [Elusimicrobiota bacterium]
MKFKDKLKDSKFLITAELYPPKGTDTSAFLRRAASLKSAGAVDAVNVTDNQRASMRAGALAMCSILLKNGIEPILQLTSRDRNRIALQTELLSANILGVENVLIISGDHPRFGEYPNVKMVYDLDTVQLIKTTQILESGYDLAGKKLNGIPKFCVGAAINPSADPQELQIAMFRKKVLAGAEFFQTQIIFDILKFKGFFNRIKMKGIKVIAGVPLLTSPKFMGFLQSLPGVEIPKETQNRINSAADPLAEGIEICAQTIKELRKFADGVHIIAIGKEEYIPTILKKSLEA